MPLLCVALNIQGPKLSRPRRVRKTGIGGEVRNGVTSGVSCEAASNRYVTPHLAVEYHDDLSSRPGRRMGGAACPVGSAPNSDLRRASRVRCARRVGVRAAASKKLGAGSLGEIWQREATGPGGVEQCETPEYLATAEHSYLPLRLVRGWREHKGAAEEVGWSTSCS